MNTGNSLELTEIIRKRSDNIIKYIMKHFNKNPKSQTSFQIYYSPEFKMYDFTIFNYKKELEYITSHNKLFEYWE